jgi:hypothetical protein
MELLAILVILWLVVLISERVDLFCVAGRSFALKYFKTFILFFKII